MPSPVLSKRPLAGGRAGWHVPFSPIKVELHDRRRVRLREIRPDDQEEVRQAFDRLSSEPRYTRFLSGVKELSPQILERAVHRQTERDLGSCGGK
jgi:hypothetical protein